MCTREEGLSWVLMLRFSVKKESRVPRHSSYSFLSEGLSWLLLLVLLLLLLRFSATSCCPAPPRPAPPRPAPPRLSPTSSQLECNELVTNDAMKDAQPLHGDIAQAQRETTLAGFRSGAFTVLVATDVAARGLDMVRSVWGSYRSRVVDPSAIPRPLVLVGAQARHMVSQR